MGECSHCVKEKINELILLYIDYRIRRINLLLFLFFSNAYIDKHEQNDKQEKENKMCIQFESKT
jgi:hypothetical protein